MGVDSGAGRSGGLGFRARVAVVLGLLLVVTVAFGYHFMLRDEPVAYADDWEHFKYGSIGSEPGGSLLDPEGGLLPPYWVFRALPKVCPEKLPGGYAEIGLIYEGGRDLPIGISRRRRLGNDMLGVNCALCHVGTLRDSWEGYVAFTLRQARESGQPRIVAGMPAGQVDVQRLIRFTLDCVQDSRFNFTNVADKIREVGGRLSLIDRVTYPLLLMPKLVAKANDLKEKIGFLVYGVPAAGPGRLDTFNPLKGTELEQPLSAERESELIGPVDFPPLWRLSGRDGRGLHWDGNTDSLDEVVRSAVLGVGVKPATVDQAGLARVTRYLMTLGPPPYPFPLDPARVAAGGALFRQHCAVCHERGVGAVTLIGEVGTDPYRLNLFTPEVVTELPEKLERRYRSPLFRFTHFRKTHGYLNVPLDGLWARAPYLHNGSVPSLRALLDPAARPWAFYRGGDVFDPTDVGFVAPLPAGASGPTPSPCPATGVNGSRPAGPPGLFLFDTRCPGNSNAGHLWGTDLAPEQKAALLEFLKTL